MNVSPSMKPALLTMSRMMAVHTIPGETNASIEVAAAHTSAEASRYVFLRPL